MRRSVLSLVSVVVLPLAFACTKEDTPAEVAPTGAAPAASEPAASSQPATAAVAPGKGESPSDRDQVDADGVVRRGEALTQAASLSVVAALEEAKVLDGKSVKVTGTVDQVCAKKGCWFVLRPHDPTHAAAAKTIRITSKGYRFFMPRSSVGQEAVVEGDLKVTTLSESEAQHLEDDRVEAEGGEAQKIVGEKVEVQIAAVAVEMRPSGS